MKEGLDGGKDGKGKGRESEEYTLYSESAGDRKNLGMQNKSFTRFVEVEAWRKPEVANMAAIMGAVESACKGVATLVRRSMTDDLAGLYDTDGGDGGVNIQGEAQKMLDIVSNRVMTQALCSPGGMSCVASEEDEYPQMCAHVVGHSDFTGEYAAVFDPLDGSSNIGAGLPCGTIFGILKSPAGGKIGPRTILQPGNQLLAAGYCLYGAQTSLVMTMGNGVHGFALDWERGEFVLTEPNIRIPLRGQMYSVNESNSVSWDGRIQDYVNDIKSGRGMSREKYTYRYAGALIADVHSILRYGGIFAYPADSKNANGKLRLLYEGNPIAFLMEQAGGAATTGFERILDVRPASTHQRVPCFFGSIEDVYELSAYLRRPL
ncbi:unnamed protein product [Chrysoparadoxa australica]